MAEQGRLTFCLDESLGRPIAEVLRTLRAPGAPFIHDAREMGLNGVSDEALMGLFRSKDVDVVVWKDSRVLAASVRRDAWRAAALTLLILDGKWGNLGLFAQARLLIWWWPELVRLAQAGPQGAAWMVPAMPKESAARRMFAEVP